MLVYKINIYPTKNVIAFKLFDLPARTPDYVSTYIIRNPANGTHHLPIVRIKSQMRFIIMARMIQFYSGV